MYLKRIVLMALAFLWAASDAHAGVLVDWNDISSGTLGPANVTFTLTNDSGASLQTFNLSGPAYSYSPGSASEEYVDHQGDSNWTVAFDQPIDDLLVYAIFWRDINNGSPSTYTFDRSFTIASGFAGTGISGNTLTNPNQFTSGILRFGGATSTLSMTTDAFGGFQGTTFGVQSFAAVPEPSGLALSGLAFGGLGIGVWRRRRARKGQAVQEHGLGIAERA